MGLSIVLPCLNEEANIPALVHRISNALDQTEIYYEVLLIDDGSVDETWDVIRSKECTDGYHQVRGIQHGSNQGIYQSWKTGVQAATQDYVCFMDSDLQNPPEALPSMWNLMAESRCDLVQGFRSSIEWDRNSRYWSSKGLNMILNLVFGDNAKDNKSGFIMGPRRVLADILNFRKTYYFPQSLIRVAARSKGYTIQETETLFLPRKAGQSFLDRKTNIGVYSRVLVDIWRGLFEFRRGVGDARNPGALGVYRFNKPLSPGYRGLRRVRFEIYFATMPLHAWLLRRSVRSLYLQLQASQWLEHRDIRSIQDAKLRRLIQHIYTHVPYYRQVMKKDEVRPSDIQGVSDLHKLPMLEKSDVRKHLYFDLFSDLHEKSDMHKITTSGSTGEPFVVFADRHQLEVRFATTLRALEWTGWRFGDKQIRLWHEKLGMRKGQVVKERLDAWLLRRRFVSAFAFTEENLRRLSLKIDRFRPYLIDGYAEALNLLDRYRATANPGKHMPSAIMSSAQVMTGQVREALERDFQCRVFDKYGAREFSGIAYQCEVGLTHHVMDESYVVELLTAGRPTKPGEVGEVVITDLNNYSMPLVRYRIGDLAVAVDNTNPCSCGRGLSRIGDVLGRTQALVHCADGRWLPGTFFAHFFKDFEHLVSFFQIHQAQKGTFRLRAVKGPQWTDVEWRGMMKRLRQTVGNTEIRVEYVTEIPLLATGKRSPVVSELKVEFQSLGAY